MDEPTRGIDVGAKAEVHALISQLAKEGVAIIMISSELPEVLGMSDRVLIMHEGHKVGELSRDQATPEHVMTLMTGEQTGEQTVTPTVTPTVMPTVTPATTPKITPEITSKH